ncbi:MAG: polysaccharide pyruvyl transferase family protein [Bacteroidetes bacterium]|nr:polysaccharide pyruvyl transferase family protein [Bacteroidota bacterium]
MANKIFLVTKLGTTNIGNQALSNEIINLFISQVGENNIIVGGRPLGLLLYDFKKMQKSDKPVELLESWADRIIRKYENEKGSKIFRPKLNFVKLVTNSSPELKYEGIKKFLRPLKKRIKKYFLYEKSYKKRLDQINSSDVLIYSGAGEVGDTIVFLRQLLEIRIAQKLGIKTGAVNQSVVVKSEVFKKLLSHVYGKMERVVVRGKVSKELLAECGLIPEKISLAPDTAILTTAIKLNRENKVGINFTPNIKFNADKIRVVIEHLRNYGNEIYFVTNEPIGDIQIGKELIQNYDIQIFPQIESYLEYASKLSQFKYIISTRLHTNILALASEVPIIALEGNQFKTSELLDQLDYPVPVINAYKDGWMDVLNEEIDKLESGKYNHNDYFSIILPAAKQKVKLNAEWLKEI